MDEAAECFVSIVAWDGVGVGQGWDRKRSRDGVAGDGEESVLLPDALRKALATAFKDQLHFQLGCMDDAAECFVSIVARMGVGAGQGWDRNGPGMG